MAPSSCARATPAPRPSPAGTGRICDALDTTLAELVAADEIRAAREVEELLADVPARLRGPVLRVIRETVLLHREAIAEYTGRRQIRTFPKP